MNVKPGTQINNLHPLLAAALPTIEEEFKAHDSYCTVTAGHEGFPGDKVHRADSKHYAQNNKSKKGEGVDIRGRHLNYPTLDDIQHNLKKKLGPAFDVVLEIADKMGNMKNHLHVEIH